jgi:hypothetical protein
MEPEPEQEPEPQLASKLPPLPQLQPCQINLRMLEDATLPDSFSGTTEAKAELLFQVKPRASLP